MLVESLISGEMESENIRECSITLEIPFTKLLSAEVANRKLPEHRQEMGSFQILFNLYISIP